MMKLKNIFIYIKKAIGVWIKTKGPTDEKRMKADGLGWSGEVDKSFENGHFD